MPKKKKLTYKQAEEIRFAYKMNPRLSYRDLERVYGVSKTLIGQIINNEIYIKEEESELEE